LYPSFFKKNGNHSKRKAAHASIRILGINFKNKYIMATLIIYKWCGYDLSRNTCPRLSKHCIYTRVWAHIAIHINELWVPHNFRVFWVQCPFDWPNTQNI
jgi:hypothetical protein